MGKPAVGTTAKFKKGAGVKVRSKNGYRTCYVWRRLTQEEREAWYASDDSKGMDSAGETKLCPRDVYHEPGDELYRVVRARVRTTRGWHEVSGCVELEDEHGVRWFASRKDLY